MGGFEGGDEGGFWDEDPILNALESKRLHTLQIQKPTIYKQDTSFSIKAYLTQPTHKNSENIYDTITIIPSTCTDFTIEGYDGISLESNLIYKAYKELVDFTEDSDIVDFFKEHKIVLIRSKDVQINELSHVAVFLLLVQELCNLVLTSDELIQIANAVDPNASSYFKLI